MISTRRFRLRPSSVSLDATGRYSLYPIALNLAGFSDAFDAKSAFIKVMARADESSQFDGYCSVAIGTLSV